jgi:hypothetical protein
MRLDTVAAKSITRDNESEAGKMHLCPRPRRSRPLNNHLQPAGRSGYSPLDARMEASYMKYMLLIYFDEQTLSDTERQECYAESAQLAQQLHASGQYLAANPLHPTSVATSVRVRDGKRFVTDGPFAETREQLGGYFLVDAKNVDEAVDIAARIPMARKGTVEVRPVSEIAGLPTA